MRWLFAAALAAALTSPSTADACACCDGFTTRTPIGWSTAGGALLIRVDSAAACEITHAIEVWPIGAAEPSGCYDLLGDPDKRVACNALTAKTPGANVRPSSRVKSFPIKPVALDDSKARVAKVKLPSQQLRITVEVAIGDTWKPVWSDTIQSAEAFTDGAGRTHRVPVHVTLYPNARGDRALMLIANEDTSPGSGHWATLVRWVELPK